MKTLRFLTLLQLAWLLYDNPTGQYILLMIQLLILLHFMFEEIKIKKWTEQYKSEGYNATVSRRFAESDYRRGRR